MNVAEPDLRGAEGARAPSLTPTEGLLPKRSYLFLANDRCLRDCDLVVAQCFRVRSDFYSALCLAIAHFSSPFTLTEFIWSPGLGRSSTGP